MNNEHQKLYHNFEFLVTVLIISGLILKGCAIPTKSSTSSPGNYTEDLTVFRPPVIKEPQENMPSNNDSTLIFEDITIAGDITYKLDSLLDSVAVNNQNKKHIQGYTIQVYTGNSRKRANDIKSEVYSILYGSRPKVSYELPNYKVKVGKYYHRLEAQRDFDSIKNVYRNAILVPQQFRIE